MSTNWVKKFFDKDDWKKNLKKKYHIKILNEDFFEVGNLNFSKLELFAGISGLIVIVAVLTTLLITRTPIANYMPGFASPATQRQLFQTQLKIDSLSKLIQTNEKYANNLRLILQGKDPIDVRKPVDSIRLANIIHARSRKDSAFKATVEEKTKYALNSDSKSPENSNFVYLYVPLKGDVTENFDYKNGINGTTVEYIRNQMLFSPIDGVLTKISKQANKLYTIQLNNKALTIYIKNVPKVLKDESQIIYAGDAIGMLIPSKTIEDNRVQISIKSGNKYVDPLKYLDF